ncbi:hypothetical protein FGO68_gene2040 [Halteria grandinella]|uniref:Uncharacterized protein n=1 Tax=Halteria grandinella TaxID=5974 RepID=A0A8J8T6N3_HALGN|nr:hypothetical protein FGO68_gene2040 [Halteria grandinella]
MTGQNYFEFKMKPINIAQKDSLQTRSSDSKQMFSEKKLQGLIERQQIRSQRSRQSLGSASKPPYIASGQKQRNHFSYYDQVEELRFQFYELKENCEKEIGKENMEMFSSIQSQYEQVIDALMTQNQQLKSENESQKTLITSLERELSKSKKQKREYQSSLEQVKTAYERSHSQILSDMETIEKLAQKQRDTISRIAPNLTVRNLETDMLGQFQGNLISQYKDMQETSKFQEEVVPSQLINELDKTTPRSARPIQQNEAKKPFQIPLLPLHNIKQQQQRLITPTQSSQKKSKSSQEIGSNSQNDSQIAVPACMLKEQMDQWDSELDETLQDCDSDHIKSLQTEFFNIYSQINDLNDKIIYKQLFSLQHNINTRLLDSQVIQRQYLQKTTAREKAMAQQDQADEVEQTLVISYREGGQQKGAGKRSSATQIGQYQKQSKSIGKASFGAPTSQNQSKVWKGERQHRPPIGSSEKKQNSSDAHLSQIMNVSYGLKMDTPVRDFSLEAAKVDPRDRDVRIEDIINAPSLSISLQTATEASMIMAEHPLSHMAVPQESEIKSRQYGRLEKSEAHDSIEQDSVLFDLCRRNVDLNLPRKDLNQQIFNIIDFGHNRASQFETTQSFKSTMHNFNQPQMANLHAPESLQSTSILPDSARHILCANAGRASSREQLPTPGFMKRSSSIHGQKNSQEYMGDTPISQILFKNKLHTLVSNNPQQSKIESQLETDPTVYQNFMSVSIDQRHLQSFQSNPNSQVEPSTTVKAPQNPRPQSASQRKMKQSSSQSSLIKLNKGSQFVNQTVIASARNGPVLGKQSSSSHIIKIPMKFIINLSKQKTASQFNTLQQ